MRRSSYGNNIYWAEKDVDEKKYMERKIKEGRIPKPLIKPDFSKEYKDSINKLLEKIDVEEGDDTLKGIVKEAIDLHFLARKEDVELLKGDNYKSKGIEYKCIIGPRQIIMDIVELDTGIKSKKVYGPFI